MIEKLFELLPGSMKGQLFIRMVYTGASFITARIIAFLSGAFLARFLSAICMEVGKVGIPLTISVGPIDQVKLQAFVTLLLMTGAEWIIQHTHTKIVLPAIQATQKPEGAVSEGVI